MCIRDRNSIAIHYQKQENDGKIVILDSAAPVSVVGTKWLENHLIISDLTREDLRSKSVDRVFNLGGNLFTAAEEYEIPIRVMDTDGNDQEMLVKACEISHELPLLCGLA